MNRSSFPFLVLILCGANVVSGGEINAVKTGGIEGVIVGEKTARGWAVRDVRAQGYWTPPSQDIASAESHLRAALEKGVQDPATIMPGPFSEFSRKHSSVEIASVLEHSKEYRRQYLGVILHGRRYVLLNSFPARESLHETQHYVSVQDGGYGFWRVLYSAEDGTFSQLSVNGSA